SRHRLRQLPGEHEETLVLCEKRELLREVALARGDVTGKTVELNEAKRGTHFGGLHVVTDSGEHELGVVWDPADIDVEPVFDLFGLHKERRAAPPAAKQSRFLVPFSFVHTQHAAL